MMMQPPPWWGAPPSHAPDANAHQQPTVQFQQEPQQAQQPKAGMLPPNQQPRPPPLKSVLSPIAGSGREVFIVKGRPTEMFHPFATQFGGALRDEMTRIYNADKDPEKSTAKATCRPVMNAIRKATGQMALCDKWITTGRCREPDCKGTHPDWDKTWDGLWLFTQCPELAAMARVPPSWAP